jgi:type III pantothenate kinase
MLPWQNNNKKKILAMRKGNEMFLSIDIGNTDTVIGLYWKEILLSECRLTNTLHPTASDIYTQIRSLLLEVRKSIKNVHGIGISSVVPSLTYLYMLVAKKYFHQEPMLVSTDLNLGIKIHYDNPKFLGPDRICSAVAGYAKYGGPLIIIDFGTATTYNVIASNGDFLGGVIAPGIATSAYALHTRTGKLPKLKGTDFHVPDSIIGTDTLSGMQAGILFGAVDATAGMVKRIQKELRKLQSKKAVVIATGGFSSIIAGHSRIIERVDPALVLDGIRLIYDRVKKKRLYK